MRRKPIILLLLAAMLANSAGCTLGGRVNIQSTDLMDGYTAAADISPKPADAAFTASQADFALSLFKQAYDSGQNTLVSPLSVTLALAMTANGADSETLSQMEQMLGGDLTISQLNEYLYGYVSGLPSSEQSKLGIANSIWFRDDQQLLEVDPHFLQRNADYYGASAYASPFDAQAVSDINSWVSRNTGGLIKQVVDEIDPNTMLYLINTVIFDAEWLQVYETDNLSQGQFTAIDGWQQPVEFMNSNEYRYLDDGQATGFIKPYVGGYSFVALLPNEGVSINSYVASLDGRDFLRTLADAEDTMVIATLPKFDFDYSINLNDVLAEMGMPLAFDVDRADFSRMAAMPDGNIYIGNVLHKTYISVDELGTKAGAATSVAMVGSGAFLEPKVVNLDRPFVFMIIDDATNLPVFIGTVLSVE